MLRRSLLASGGAILATPALAQGTWPSRPVAMVVAFGPGGANDLMMRLMADGLQRRFNSPFVVENRPGGSARVAAAHVARQAPDGYTFLMGTPGIMALNPLVFREMNYRPADFTPISLVGGLPYGLIVNRNLPVTNVQELIALARQRDGRLNHGSTGTGPTFVQNLLQIRANVRFENILYPGTPPALNDLLRGDVHFMFDLMPGIIGQIRSGDVRALAVSAPARVPGLDNVPTMREAGVPDFDATNWVGVIAPAGVPDAIADRMSEAIQEIVRTPAVNQRITELGAIPVGSTRAQFAAHIAGEQALWADVAQRAGIRPE